MREPGPSGSQAAWAGGGGGALLTCTARPPLPVGQDVAGGPVAEADEEGAKSFVPEQLLGLPGQSTCPESGLGVPKGVRQHGAAPQTLTCSRSPSSRWAGVRLGPAQQLRAGVLKPHVPPATRRVQPP